jgi:hypothetical protein
MGLLDAAQRLDFLPVKRRSTISYDIAIDAIM